MKDRICVILVNYNGRAYNHKCIKSILDSVVDGDINVIFVDNASTDGSLDDIKRNWRNREEIKILELDDNYGFAKGNNEGIKYALEHGAEYILLLNNDTEIQPDTITKMVELQKEKKSIIVPKIMYADQKDTIWYAGGELSRWLKKAVHSGKGTKDKGKFASDRSCTFANGCCMLLSKEIIEKIGLLDEQFFLYYEDNEYSLRAEKYDIKIWYCAGAVVYHKVSGSTKGNDKPANAYYITRNWLICNRIYIKKYICFFYCYFVVNRLAWFLIWKTQGKDDMIRAMWKGIEDYKNGCTGKWNNVD